MHYGYRLAQISSNHIKRLKIATFLHFDTNVHVAHYIANLRRYSATVRRLRCRVRQANVLDAAKKENDLSRLYWFIEMRIPPQSRAKRFTEGYCPAAWPEAHVPVIPVGDEPESSRAVADFLAAMVRCNNPRIMEAAPALCDAESLATAGCAWYVYGEAEFDTICYACGAVGRVIHYAAGDGWLCATCSAEHEP